MLSATWQSFCLDLNVANLGRSFVYLNSFFIRQSLEPPNQWQCVLCSVWVEVLLKSSSGRNYHNFEWCSGGQYMNIDQMQLWLYHTEISCIATSISGLILGLCPANDRCHYKQHHLSLAGHKPGISPVYHDFSGCRCNVVGHIQKVIPEGVVVHVGTYCWGISSQNVDKNNDDSLNSDG